jgi:ABC-type sugar transport system substrate-binding protein
MPRAAGGLVLAGLLAALAHGCGGDDKKAQPEPRNVRVAAVIKGLDNPFFRTMRGGLVETARQHNVRLRLVAAPAGLQDTAGQASALASLVSDRRACYVVNPINATNLIPPLANIPAGTPIINLDSVVAQRLAQGVGVKITSYIGTNNVAGGRLGADAMAALVKPGARVAVIAGIPGDIGSGSRTEGFTTGARGRFDVVETVAADFERGKARLATEELLRVNPGIDGFFAVNDLMALGVADAVRAAGRRGEVAVVGFDGIRQALAAVRKGDLSATVAQYPYSIGQLGVEGCLAAVRGDSVPRTVDAPVQVVTRQNVERALASFPKPPGQFESPFAASAGR